MSNEELRILKNTIEQMACDADDKGLTDFGLRLSVADAFTLCKLEPPRRWIPCSERLPGTNGKAVSCLAYIPSFGAVDIADYHPGVDEWLYMCLPVTVTHWMPLPELPKEGGDGNGLD